MMIEMVKMIMISVMMILMMSEALKKGTITASAT